MNTLSIENYGVTAISDYDLIEIVGGHDGTAYQVGHFIGEALQVIGVVGGILAFGIFAGPKGS